MGVDCRLFLPPAARVRDVADVAGRLLGCPGHLLPLRGGGVAARIEGVRVDDVSTLPECCRIVVEPPSGETWSCLYHFEGGDGELAGYRVMLPRSTAINIAIGRRLIDFFGGVLDEADCDNIHVDYHKHPERNIHPTDGEPWDEFQRALVAVEPLTHDEIESCRANAGYPDR